MKRTPRDDPLAISFDDIADPNHHEGKTMEQQDPIENLINAEPVAEPAPKVSKPKPMPAPSRDMLTEEVAALVASLGVTSPGKPGQPYDPDAFIAAIRTVHDQLRVAKDALAKQAADLKRREGEVLSREQAVGFREAKVNALHKLADVFSVEVSEPVAAPARPVNRQPARRPNLFERIFG